MSKFIKENKLILLLVLIAIVIYIGSFFVVTKSIEDHIAAQWSATLEGKVDSIMQVPNDEKEMANALQDTLGHFYITDKSVPVVAFFRGGAIEGSINGAVFYSTLDECSASNYNKVQDAEGNTNPGIENYLKIKGIYDLYKKVVGSTDTGEYKYITIDDEKYYIIYTYSQKLHISVLGFVPATAANFGTETIILSYIIMFIIITALFFSFIIVNNSNVKKYKIERDEALETMRDKEIRMDMLSYLMNEFTFEYDIKHDVLSFADKYQKIFQRGKIFPRFLETLKTRYNIYHLDQQNIQAAFDNIMNGQEEGSALFRLQMPNGNYEWFNSVYKVMRSNDGNPIYVVGKIMNVHQAQTEKEMLLTKSTRDPLTNLLNRSELEKRTSNYISEMADDDIAAIVIMDLDHFKQVNDTFGHSKGDELLVEVAGIIRDTFRTSDIVGRLGGDEFFIFMKDLMSENDAVSKCEKLRAQLDRSVSYGDTSVKISTSMGIHYVKAGDAFLDIYMKADSALYHAKEEGRNRYCIQREGDEINSTKS